MSGVVVNETAIFATQRGLDWWLDFRAAHELTGRITVLTASIGGDRVSVTCDDREHATWLAVRLAEEDIPASAVKVIR